MFIKTILSLLNALRPKYKWDYPVSEAIVIQGTLIRVTSSSHMWPSGKTSEPSLGARFADATSGSRPTQGTSASRPSVRACVSTCPGFSTRHSIVLRTISFEILIKDYLEECTSKWWWLYVVEIVALIPIFTLVSSKSCFLLTKVEKKSNISESFGL